MLKNALDQVFKSQFYNVVKSYGPLTEEVTKVVLAILTIALLSYLLTKVMFTFYGLLKTLWTPTVKSTMMCDNCESTKSRQFYRVSPCGHLICFKCYPDYCKITYCNCYQCPTRYHTVCQLCYGKRDNVVWNE